MDPFSTFKVDAGGDEMRPLQSIYDFLAQSDVVSSCDLVIALAGRPERKSFALSLLRQGRTRRIIISTGRYEVRQTAATVPEIAGELLALRDATLPARRHFWLDVSSEHTTVSHAKLTRSGTFEELEALADRFKLEPVRTVGLVSTSIHLHRVRFCCSRIPFFRQKQLLFWAVPEGEAPPKRDSWWKRPADCGYVCKELLKLVGYNLVYR